MTDNSTTEKRSRNMRAIRSADTKPERLVRSAAHKLGYRFRLHRNDLPGRPDMVFPRLKKIILIHGCFWHSHSDCGTAHIPKTNAGYWQPKLARTRMRDAKNLKELNALGWEVLVLWECQLRDLESLRQSLKEFLGSSPGH